MSDVSGATTPKPYVLGTLITAIVMLLVAAPIGSFCDGMGHAMERREFSQDVENQYGARLSDADVRALERDKEANVGCTVLGTTSFWLTWIGGTLGIRAVLRHRRRPKQGDGAKKDTGEGERL